MFTGTHDHYAMLSSDMLRNRALDMLIIFSCTCLSQSVAGSQSPHKIFKRGRNQRMLKHSS